VRSAHLIHLLLLGFWGGLVLAETVVEVALRHRADARTAARLHFWMDVCIELPLLLGILATGGWMLWTVWPPPRILIIKVVLALVAITANLVCMVLVILRWVRQGDPAAVERLGRWVRATAVGIPFGVVALYLGLTRFHW